MTNTMCARAVLSCRPNSHPFQDRTLPLDQPIKIGRSVARARPSPNNAIFDCKVLSRNHALLWYETENGKPLFRRKYYCFQFYLQDTKSSNGTFVNNQRLSKSSEESAPRELCSGDIVQFGVDVMEVNKKLTHGCIIANVQLFLPDGKEAKASSSTIVPEKATSTPVQDIYLLNQYLKEAMLREQVLENKLAIMTKHLAGTKEFMEQNWKALIEEDRLLTRVDILERQLQASHKSMTEDKLREEVIQLLQDKEKYQNVAKDALRKAMHEKLDVTKKFKDTERNLQELESQKISLEELCDRNFKELKDLAEKYEQAEQNKKEITEEMNLSTQKYKDELESLNLKIKEKEDALREKKQLIIDLVTKMDSKIAKSILSAHNEDVAAILPPKDAIIHVESSESNDSENRLQDLNDNKLRNE
ncbi:Sarcolemmal membrane-associated protein, partial [Orchesella cincta]